MKKYIQTFDSFLKENTQMDIPSGTGNFDSLKGPNWEYNQKCLKYIEKYKNDPIYLKLKNHVAQAINNDKNRIETSEYEREMVQAILYELEQKGFDPTADTYTDTFKMKVGDKIPLDYIIFDSW